MDLVDLVGSIVVGLGSKEIRRQRADPTVGAQQSQQVKPHGKERGNEHNQKHGIVPWFSLSLLSIRLCQDSLSLPAICCSSLGVGHDTIVLVSFYPCVSNVSVSTQVLACGKVVRIPVLYLLFLFGALESKLQAAGAGLLI